MVRKCKVDEWRFDLERKMLKEKALDIFSIICNMQILAQWRRYIPVPIGHVIISVIKLKYKNKFIF